MSEGRNVRRDPDLGLTLRRNPPRGEAGPVIHEEEERVRGGQCYYPPVGGRRRPSQSQSEQRIPGPFWGRHRRDERREVDVPRRRRFEVSSEIRSVIHEGQGGAGPYRRQSFSGHTSGMRPARRPAQSASGTRIPGPFWLRQRPDERREVDVHRRRKFSIPSEIRDVIHEGGRTYDLPSRSRPSSSSRIPGPFWMVQRPDERREVDVTRRRKYPPRGEMQDVIHGEEIRLQEWIQRQRERQMQRQRIPFNPYDLPPGPSHADPFWLMERRDERRDPDMDRKRKFRRKKIQAAEIIHGEDFRSRWDPHEEPPEYSPDESEDDDDESYDRSCKCGPPPGYDFEFGPPENWVRGRDFDVYEEDWSMENAYDIPPDVEETMRRPPVGRVSCVPTTEASNFDQPNAFMRKLYQKYPYLYQVLQETPPEELISRVFKDRFMSTYQVDYLHMGVGRTSEEEYGARGDKGRGWAGPDGEPEPDMIPGCSYRHSQKGDFGRKKYKKPDGREEREERDKDRDKDEIPPSQDEREEPRISEYMATISRLGNDIMQDRLYRVAEITKSMKNQYKKL